MTPDDNPTDELDLDAAEFVLGTLPPVEQMRFEMRLRNDRLAQGRVVWWQRRLAPLLGLIEPVEPPAALLERIERSIQRQGRPSRGKVFVPLHRRIWNSLSLWRGLAFGSALLAAAFAGLLVVRPLPQGPGAAYIAILDDTSGNPMWLVSADPAAGAVSIDPVGQMSDGDRVPELWLIPAGSPVPVSLGVLDPDARMAMELPAEHMAGIGGGAMLAVSLEPTGGSPTGRPTGPVVQQGRIVPYLP
ncbi:MAG TPA: anti-sigma factor [Geminicoccus sp.]|uniref:anti-sigma factor n=1 Tax=Geminicoccus sp. TaxID=2024832 RepID=UPI002B942A8F|nr:anti-sigma factor [Geminicoccus sp.]HWL68300.1 anti-sigma factor [Geminicoccus sp.]